MRKDDDRRGGVNIKVEKLNRRTNERGDDNFITRVDRGAFLFECCGGSLHRIFLFLANEGPYYAQQKRHFNL